MWRLNNKCFESIVYTECIYVKLQVFFFNFFLLQNLSFIVHVLSSQLQWLISPVSICHKLKLLSCQIHMPNFIRLYHLQPTYSIRIHIQNIFIQCVFLSFPQLNFNHFKIFWYIFELLRNFQQNMFFMFLIYSKIFRMASVSSAHHTIFGASMVLSPHTLDWVMKSCLLISIFASKYMYFFH